MQPVVDQVEPPRRRPGRPRGATAQGVETRQRLYETAIRLIAERGWQETTLRDIASAAGVSVGLLYRYFPSKRAVVLALYDNLSAVFVERAADPPPASWRVRFLDALRTSLDVLRPHRATLGALVGVLVGDAQDGIFSPATAFSRERVQSVFVAAVAGATDSPEKDTAPALGRLLYLVHLAVLLLWLLDRSPAQRASAGLIALLEQMLPLVALGLRVPGASELLVKVDALVQDALVRGPSTAPSSLAKTHTE